MRCGQVNWSLAETLSHSLSLSLSLSLSFSREPWLPSDRLCASTPSSAPTARRIEGQKAGSAANTHSPHTETYLRHNCTPSKRFYSSRDEAELLSGRASSLLGPVHQISGSFGRLLPITARSSSSAAVVAIVRWLHRSGGGNSEAQRLDSGRRL